MKTLLQQLYDGELYPAENIKPKDPEYSKTHHRIADEREYFMGILAANDKERLVNLDEMYFHSAALYAYENFTYGFRLGVSLMAETLANGGGFGSDEE